MANEKPGQKILADIVQMQITKQKRIFGRQKNMGEMSKNFCDKDPEILLLFGIKTYTLNKK